MRTLTWCARNRVTGTVRWGTARSARLLVRRCARVRQIAMNASKESLLSSARGGGSRASISAGVPLRAVRIPCNVPAPDQWTLVREVNMEKREPCEIWRSGVNHQLRNMKLELLRCSRILQELEGRVDHTLGLEQN